MHVEVLKLVCVFLEHYSIQRNWFQPPRYNIFYQNRFGNVPFLRLLSHIYAYATPIKYNSNSIIIIIGSGLALFVDYFRSDHYFEFLVSHNAYPVSGSVLCLIGSSENDRVWVVFCSCLWTYFRSAYFHWVIIIALW